MGCSNSPNVKSNNQTNQNNTLKNEFPNLEPIEEIIDFSEPFKELNYSTSNILFLKDGKIMLANRAEIHIFYNLNFENPYVIKVFRDYIQCFIELSNGYIAVCSNDNSLKILEIGERTYKIISEIVWMNQLWSLAERPNFGHDIVVGDVKGLFFYFQKTTTGYVCGEKLALQNSTILNILSLTASLLMMVYMNYGIIFFNCSTYETVATINHQYFNPFKRAIKKISNHELLIGAEYSIILVDYKTFEKIKEFDSNSTYSINRLNKEYLLCSSEDGYIESYKMEKTENDELDLSFQKKLKFIQVALLE